MHTVWISAGSSADLWHVEAICGSCGGHETSTMMSTYVPTQLEVMKHLHLSFIEDHIVCKYCLEAQYRKFALEELEF